MEYSKYTPDQIARVGHFCDAIEKFSPDKRFIALIAAESFINGMNAKERLDGLNSVQRIKEEGKTPWTKGQR